MYAAHDSDGPQSPRAHKHMHFSHVCLASLCPQVYDAAQRLDVPGVSRACKAFSNELIASTSTVCSMLQQALQFQLHETVAQCYESVRERYVVPPLRPCRQLS